MPRAALHKIQVRTIALRRKRGGQRGGARWVTARRPADLRGYGLMLVRVWLMHMWLPGATALAAPESAGRYHVQLRE